MAGRVLLFLTTVFLHQWKAPGKPRARLIRSDTSLRTELRITGCRAVGWSKRPTMGDVVVCPAGSCIPCAIIICIRMLGGESSTVSLSTNFTVGGVVSIESTTWGLIHDCVRSVSDFCKNDRTASFRLSSRCRIRL